MLENNQISRKLEDQSEIAILSKNTQFNKDKVKTSLQNKHFYDNFFEGNNQDVNIDSHIQKMSKNKIFYQTKNYAKKIKIIKISETVCSQIVVLQVSFAYFCFQLTILNLSQTSFSFSELQLIGNGANGTIFQGHTFNGNIFAVKNIKYTIRGNINSSTLLMQNSMQQNLLKLILQYCIYKLCSCLKIGPRIENYFMFDLLIYNQTAQFTMELCHKKQLKQLIDLSHLKEALKLLHSIQIIHGDIKPQNIMWSSAFNKFVFIDFGFSKFIEEPIGDCTLTAYFGTYIYSSPQMRVLYTQRSTGYIDLYYNDAYCLVQTFKVNKNKQKYKNKNIQKQKVLQSFLQDQQQEIKKVKMNHKYNQFIFNTQLQRNIFDKNLGQVKLLCQKNIYYQLNYQTIQLLFQIKPSRKTLEIVYYLLNNYYTVFDTNLLNLQLYHQRKIIEVELNQNKKNIFGRRIKLNNFSKTSSFNDIIEFVKFFFKQDLSTREKIIKQNLKQSLKLYQKDSKTYWTHFQMYVSNLYTSFQQILDLFDQVKQTLQIKDWEKVQNIQFKVTIRAYQIWKAVLSKYGYDLVKLNFVQTYYRCYKYSKQLIQQQKQNQQPFCSILQHQKQIFQDFKKKQNKEINNQIFQRIIKKIKRRSGNKLSNLSQLSIQYLQYLKENSEKQKLKRAYKIIQKAGNIEIVSKCEFMLNVQLQQIDFHTSFCQNNNQFIYRLTEMQSTLYNYCFNPTYLFVSYFYINIFSKVSSLILRQSKQRIQHEMDKICQNLKKFKQIQVQISNQSLIGFFNLIRKLSDLVQNEGNQNISRPVRKFIKQYITKRNQQLKLKNNQIISYYIMQQRFNKQRFSSQLQLQKKTNSVYYNKKCKQAQYLTMVNILETLQKCSKNNKYSEQMWNEIKKFVDWYDHDKTQITQQKITFLIAIIQSGLIMKQKINQIDQYAKVIQNYITCKQTDKKFNYYFGYYCSIKQTLCHYYVKNKHINKSFQILFIKIDNNQRNQKYVPIYFMVMNYFKYLSQYFINFDIFQFIYKLKYYINGYSAYERLKRTQTFALLQILLSLYISGAALDGNYKINCIQAAQQIIKIASYLKQGQQQVIFSRLILKMRAAVAVYSKFMSFKPRKQIMTYLRAFRNQQYAYSIFSDHFIISYLYKVGIFNKKIKNKNIIESLKEKVHTEIIIKLEQYNKNKQLSVEENIQMNQTKFDRNMIKNFNSIITELDFSGYYRRIKS